MSVTYYRVVLFHDIINDFCSGIKVFNLCFVYAMRCISTHAHYNYTRCFQFQCFVVVLLLSFVTPTA